MHASTTNGHRLLRRVATAAERAANPVPKRTTVTGSGIGTGRGTGVAVGAGVLVGPIGVSDAVGAIVLVGVGVLVLVGAVVLVGVDVAGSAVGVSAEGAKSWANVVV